MVTQLYYLTFFLWYSILLINYINLASSTNFCLISFPIKSSAASTVFLCYTFWSCRSIFYILISYASTVYISIFYMLHTWLLCCILHYIYCTVFYCIVLLYCIQCYCIRDQAVVDSKMLYIFLLYKLYRFLLLIKF